AAREPLAAVRRCAGVLERGRRGGMLHLAPVPDRRSWANLRGHIVPTSGAGGVEPAHTPRGAQAGHPGSPIIVTRLTQGNERSTSRVDAFVDSLLVGLEQGPSRPVLRAWRSPVGAAAD